VKIGFKFQSLGKISNISTSDSPVLLGQFQHCPYPVWWGHSPHMQSTVSLHCHLP